jgi:hypothetical protein
VACFFQQKSQLILEFDRILSAYRNLCGFLNSGLGGTVYVGVQDDGTVGGVRVTQYQQDHLLLSLQDAMNAFRPPVPSFMYSTKFIPVLEPGDDYPHQLQVYLYKLLILNSHSS